jgi:hypothetical protein
MPLEKKIQNYLSVGGIRGRPPASLGGDMRSFKIGDRGLRVSILRRCSDAADGSQRIFSGKTAGEKSFPNMHSGRRDPFVFQF